MKIIVTESIALEGIEHLKQKGYEVDVKFGISREDLLKIIQEYDALIVRSVTKVNEELLEKASALKVVGRAGNGVDNIDLKAATARGIIVVNTPESNIMAAAELAVADAYAIFRNLIQAVEAGRHGDFREIYRQRAGRQNGGHHRTWQNRLYRGEEADGLKYAGCCI